MRRSDERAEGVDESRLKPAGPVDARGVVRVRARYCECDPMGVVHHGAYVAWLEMGRTELLRPTGISYRDMEAAGVFLVVTRLELRYHRPARYDDELDVETRIVRATRARIDYEYEVRRVGDETGAALVTATSTLACVDETGRPRGLPGWLVGVEGA